jgi:hypothetical protein
MCLDDLTPSNEAAKAAPMTASQAYAAPLSASAASAVRNAQVASNSLLPFAATGDVSRLYDLIETPHQQEALTSSHRIIQDTLTAHLASRSMPRLVPAAIDIKQPADDLQKALNEQNLMQHWPCILQFTVLWGCAQIFFARWLSCASSLLRRLPSSYGPPCRCSLANDWPNFGQAV